MLLLTLAVAPFAGRSDDGARVATAGSGDGEVVEASTGDAVLIRELLAQTTSTLVEATTAPSSTTTSTTEAAPSTTTTAAEATTTTAAARTTTAAQETTTTSAAPTTAPPPPTTTTTAPPTTTTTAPPTTTTTTTAPPRTEESAEGEEQYAYDDPRSTQVWYDLADCEAGGNWYIDSGNGYYGGLQFSLASWESVGGTGYPNEHPPETQIDMGRRLQARQGWDAWPHCSEKLGLS